MSNTITLYDRAEALAIVAEWLEESGGEITPEIAEALEQAEGDFAAKTERIALFVRSLDATAEAIKAEEQRLAARRKARENAAARLRDYLQGWMTAAGQPRVETPVLTVAIQKNPPSVVCDRSEDDLLAIALTDHPFSAYVAVEQVTTVKLDKKALLAAVKADPSLPLPDGVTVRQTESLRIR